MDADVLAELENERAERDVTFYLYVNYSGITRHQDGSMKEVFAGSVADEKYSSQAVLFIIPRSLWQQTIQRFSMPTVTSLKDLAKMSAEISAAKSEAEQAAKAAQEAAKAAKEAATLTAVTNLAQAYQEEAVTLKRRSWIWALFCIAIAAGIAYGISAFIKESLSLGSNFNVSIAILRSVVLAVAFGIFSLCLRVYESYRHLEVVNRHRVNIGRTFEAFKAAQPTERAQEIMSAITAEHMLAFGKSGFAPKDSPNQGPLTDFSELLKSVLDKKP
jgi:cation transport ATPase